MSVRVTELTRCVPVMFNLRVAQQIPVKRTFIFANMAEEEVAKCVVDNDSGFCKASSAGDDAVDNGSGTCKRRK